MKNVAIIPARGGSKRIPRKNIKDFHGKPMIAYPISVARESRLFDRIIVSTDDEEIAQVARDYGAEIPFMRPKELADDYTGTNAVVKHALEWLRKNNYFAQYACCIYATAPFIQARNLNDGYEKLVSSGKDYVISVTTFSFPIQRAIKVNSRDEVEPFFPECIPSRSQDLEEAFHDAGQFYWGKAESYLHDVSFFDSTSSPLIIPRQFVQDIDTIEDWKFAEYMFISIQCSNRASSDNKTSMKKRNICIRPAIADDCQDIFDMISDPEVRNATFKQNMITLDEHRTWFQAALKSPDRLLFIIEDNSNYTLGMLRFDIQKTHADVSIVLNKDSRGHGYGPQSLHQGCDTVYQSTKIANYRAYVRSDNIPSRKAFSKAGFVYSDTTTIADAVADIFAYTIADSTTNAL
jgi:pseudaminic acid cytidylyltransferase